MPTSPARRIKLQIFAGTVSLAAMLLSGCSFKDLSSSGAVTTQTHLNGKIFGGQQPIVGATIQLYAVGTTGLAAASTPLIGSQVLSDGNGFFSITGTYSCTNATQVYIVATGGNPGAGVNSFSTLAAALGSCSDLTANTYISMNELTTVAAAYALAPFAGSDYTSIGANTSAAPGSVGLPNAFAAAGMLVDSSTGLQPTTLPPGLTVPGSELNTLADILAACINSTGPASTPCSQLNSATSTNNTFDAALYIARNPGLPAVVGLYSLQTPGAPFQPALASAPSDFTLAVHYTGTSGAPLSSPTGIAIDASGNALVTNQTGNSVTAISPLSTALVTANNIAANAGGLNGPQGISIDTNDFVWIANTGGHNVVELAQLRVYGSAASFASVNSRAIGGFSSAASPVTTATDQNGNAFTVSAADDEVYAISGASGAVSGSLVNASFAGSSAIALSDPGTLAVGTGAGQMCTLATGLGTPTCTTQSSATAITALGYNASLSSAGYAALGTGNPAPPLYASAAGTAATTFASPAGTAPVAVAFDNAGNAFLPYNNALFEYNSSTSLSPAGGFGVVSTPQGVAVDPSGNVWITNSGDNSVSIFIGLAASTLTPVAANLH